MTDDDWEAVWRRHGGHRRVEQTYIPPEISAESGMSAYLEIMESLAGGGDLNDVLDIVDAYGSGRTVYKVEWLFEVFAGMLNDMKDVLECLKYYPVDLPVEVKCSWQNPSYAGDDATQWYPYHAENIWDTVKSAYFNYCISDSLGDYEQWESDVNYTQPGTDDQGRTIPPSRVVVQGSYFQTTHDHLSNINNKPDLYANGNDDNPEDVWSAEKARFQFNCAWPGGLENNVTTSAEYLTPEGYSEPGWFIETMALGSFSKQWVTGIRFVFHETGWCDDWKGYTGDSGPRHGGPDAKYITIKQAIRSGAAAKSRCAIAVVMNEGWSTLSSNDEYNQHYFGSIQISGAGVDKTFDCNKDNYDADTDYWVSISGWGQCPLLVTPFTLDLGHLPWSEMEDDPHFNLDLAVNIQGFDEWPRLVVPDEELLWASPCNTFHAFFTIGIFHDIMLEYNPYKVDLNCKLIE